MRISSLLLCLALCLALTRASLVVQTTYGPVLGATTATSKVWLGIPFAAPPVGNLRWQPPVAPQPWTDVLDATSHAPACPQAANVLVPGAVTSEDCLFIQVYAPLHSTPESNLPVYYYIYGGGFRSGSPEKYDGQFMAGDDVITVVAAYRLGPLGFLGHPLLRDLNSFNTTGNYAVQDQRFGMEWVKQNIRAFGGNPDDVTIGGTSAGGGSICVHLVSPRSAQYFNKAIIESAASCTNLPVNMNTAYSRGDTFINNLGCNLPTNAEKLACMYAATPAQILAASTSAGPVQDTYELMETPIALVRKGQFKKVPLIMGTQANESAPNYCGNPISAEQFATSVAAKYPSNAAVLLATYNLTNYPTATAAGNAVDSDTAFICPSKSFEDAYSAQYPNIWVYNFDEYPFYATGGVGTRECLGASHTFNLGFTFPSFYISRLPQNPLPDPILTPAEEILAYKWRKAQANFIKTGTPQVAEIGRVWPTYTFEEGHFLNVDLGDWWVGTHFKNDYCPAWGIPSSDTSCEKSVSISQTHTGSWNDGTTDYNQYTVSVTTGSSPIYAAELIIRFNIVPFTSGPFDSLVSYYGLTRNALGLYEINDWRLQSGRAVPPYTTLTFGYVARSDGPAVISVGTASCVPPPKDCHVASTLTLSGSWSDGQRYFQAYDFAFTNQGDAETDFLTVQLSLPAGSYPSQAWNLQTSQSQADIIATGSVTYTAPLWGLNPHQTATSSGFILSSPVQNAPKPTFAVTSTTCL